MKNNLSILIPTYNRADRLKKSLSAYTKEKIKGIEFIVIDNNSIDNTKALVEKFISEDKRIKYFKNPFNLGYNRNLYRGFLESCSDWICILPDDDSIEEGFLSELISVIEKNKDCSILIPALKVDNTKSKYPFDKTTRIKKGKKAFEIAFKYCGAATGLTFNKLKINENEWHLDGLIYPQIRIAVYSSIENDILYFIPKHFPNVGNHDSVTTAINDDMNRPDDFGIFERLEILLESSKNFTNKERLNLINSLSIVLFNWGINICKEIYFVNKKHSLGFLKNLMKNSFIMSSMSFHGILFFKFILNNKFNFKYKISIAINILKSIFLSIFKKNLYQSSYYIINNFKNLKIKNINS